MHPTVTVGIRMLLAWVVEGQRHTTLDAVHDFVHCGFIQFANGQGLDKRRLFT